MAMNNLILAKRSFYIGNYNESIACAKRIDKNDELYLPAQIILYRAFVSKKQSQVIVTEHEKFKDLELICIAHLAKYMCQPQKIHECIESILEISQKPMRYPEIAKICLATIFINEGKYEESLQTLHNSDDFDCLSLYIHTLLLMNRIDLAMSYLERMKKIDEDNTLTQMCMIVVYLRVPEKLSEALKIINELSSSIAPTALLYTYESAYYANKFEWAKSYEFIEKAQQLEPLDLDILSNHATISYYLNRPLSDIQSAFETIVTRDPQHLLVQSEKKLSKQFDELCDEIKLS